MHLLLDAPTHRTRIRPEAMARAPAGPQRILVADDDAMVRASLAEVLELEGYVVDQARNGIESVTRAIQHRPNLVLLDLNMPHWDGWTAFSQLDRAEPLLPIIVITARPNQYEKAVRLGVDAFMEKPLDIPVLLRSIRSLTNETQAHHLRRITDHNFVTRLLESHSGEPPRISQDHSGAWNRAKASSNSTPFPAAGPTPRLVKRHLPSED